MLVVPLKTGPLAGSTLFVRTLDLQEAANPPTPRSVTRFRRSQGEAGGPGGKNAEGSGSTSTGTASPKAPPGAPDPQQQCMTSLLMMGGFFVLLYFLMIRPQKKQEQQRKAMLAALKKGDRVVTNGGIHAQVVSVDEQTAVLKFGNDPGQRFTIDRAAIGRVRTKEGKDQD